MSVDRACPWAPAAASRRARSYRSTTYQRSSVARCFCWLLLAGVLMAPTTDAFAQAPGRAWLGVNIDHRAYENPRTRGGTVGVSVVYVWVGSPARDAGIQLRDILLEVDGHGIENVEDAVCLIAMHAPGDKV